MDQALVNCYSCGLNSDGFLKMFALKHKVKESKDGPEEPERPAGVTVQQEVMRGR